MAPAEELAKLGLESGHKPDQFFEGTWGDVEKFKDYASLRELLTNYFAIRKNWSGAGTAMDVDAIDKATVNPTLLGVILSANLVAVALFAGEMSGVSLGSLTAALPAAAPVV